MRQINIKELCRLLHARKLAVKKLERRLNAIGVDIAAGGLVDNSLTYDSIFEELVLPRNLSPSLCDRIMDDWTIGTDFDAFWTRYGNYLVSRDG